MSFNHKYFSYFSLRNMFGNALRDAAKMTDSLGNMVLGRISYKESCMYLKDSFSL